MKNWSVYLTNFLFFFPAQGNGAWHVSPWMGAAAGGLLSLIALFALGVLRARRARARHARAPPASEEKLCPPPGAPVVAPPAVARRQLPAQPPKEILPPDDRDPDVIPANYGEDIFFVLFFNAM